jgi:SOS response associated peptidase (SRAP)
MVRWGLIPSWAKDQSVAAQTINARSETAATKPAFRDPLTGRKIREMHSSQLLHKILRVFLSRCKTDSILVSEIME